jgi:hypothetical protein
MKRDPRLHGLTSDHHHALVLARRVRTACASGRADGPLAGEVCTAYDAQLAPHFAVEEEVLLPALAAAGEHALVERTLADHGRLRALVAGASRGETASLGEFATVLHDHVRFEEDELFPVCERRLPDEVLDEARRRAPKA